ncbi:hypothetical protein Npun_F6294 [Nostoc punctiforme PCC 73102]|uniref:Uncharacterized protein n=1 Tax=Nostoc punctiforme (strain ATCC 29133 / PCC 73102) TaxID=63737 RepID=B2IX36_NOSP7|nr:hypothetical protein Npun_F6294 [Nostoc punctiforme PCC 73102]
MFERLQTDVRMKFQSLIGILMNCNVANWRAIAGIAVSIPNRDFDELQLAFSIAEATSSSVSIPNRDFDELQFIFRFLRLRKVSVFQSLIGILMNCNSFLSRLERDSKRFNP